MASADPKGGERRAGGGAPVDVAATEEVALVTLAADEVASREGGDAVFGGAGALSRRADDFAEPPAASGAGALSRRADDFAEPPAASGFA
jgi:hypothetical protein